MRARTTLALFSVLVVALFARTAVAGGAITSGATVAGAIAGPSYLETWTFNGVLGQRVFISAVSLAGPLDVDVTLKRPGGVVEASTIGNVLDASLGVTGVYTIEVRDTGLNDAGSYNITFINVTGGPLTSAGDADGGAIASAEQRNGSLVVSDIDPFTFSGVSGQRVLFVAKPTAGVAPFVYIYGPSGAGYLTYASNGRLDAYLNATGTWTVLVMDSDNNTAGSYTCTFMNVTGGPHSFGADTDAGAVASDQIKSGTFGDVSDIDAFTFSGTTGQRVFFSNLPTGAGSHDVLITLYQPNGFSYDASSTADVFDVQLSQTGTYVVVVEEYGNDATGAYLFSFVNLTTGGYTFGGDTGGPITSGTQVSGTMSGAGDLDAYTFSGTANQRVLMSAKATAGAGFDTFFYVYGPSGAGYLTYSSERIDVQLNATGTWTIIVMDTGANTPGSYTLSFMNVTAGPYTTGGDTDGGVAIASDEIKTGTLQSAQDIDVFTFTGTAGHRLAFTNLITSGSPETYISLYPPNGGTAETASTGGYFDFPLSQTGTYYIVIEDLNNDETGSYLFSVVDMTSGPYTFGADTDGGAITSGAHKSGTTSGPGDIDVFTFSATSGQRVLMTLKTLSGAGHDGFFYLFGPNGVGYLTYSSERIDAQLNATGTWSVLVIDSNYDSAGSYKLSFMNLSVGPYTTGGDTDGGVAIVSDEIKSGTFQVNEDMDVFTFAGTAGRRLFLNVLPTGGGAHDPLFSIYPPDGTPALTAGTTTAFDLSLPQTGTYRIVMEEYAGDNTGTYTFSLVDMTNGPYTLAPDTDGGAISSAEMRTGNTSGIADIDVFTFSGSTGQRVLINSKSLSGGGYDSFIYLYAPNGGGYLTYASDRIDAQLNATGTWSVVVIDTGSDTPGDYTLSFLNISTGPYTFGADTDGGVALLSNEARTGSFQVAQDMDAFTFSTGTNTRHVFVARATGAGTHDPYVSVYPPGGGPAEVVSLTDRFDHKTATSGTYVVVVEDYANDNAGTYSLMRLNITSGAFTSAGDLNGGPIASNQIIAGNIALGDVDGFQFNAYKNSRVLLSAIATAGVGFDTFIYLYPPDGDGYLTYSGERIDAQITKSGLWTITVEDNGVNTTGDYVLSLLNLQYGPFTSAPETDGGPVSDNVTKNGSAIGFGDFDGYTIYCLGGQSANVTCTTTSGAMNTATTVYPEDGSGALASTISDVFSVVIPVGGYYTFVVEDQGQDQTGTYSFKVDLTGTPTPVGNLPPAELALLPATPSPFSHSTEIGFEVPKESRIRMRVYDVRGALVRDLVNGRRGIGRYSERWDGRDERGAQVASGVYYLHLDADGVVKRQKLVLVR